MKKKFTGLYVSQFLEEFDKHCTKFRATQFESKTKLLKHWVEDAIWAEYSTRNTTTPFANFDEVENWFKTTYAEFEYKITEEEIEKKMKKSKFENPWDRYMHLTGLLTKLEKANVKLSDNRKIGLFTAYLSSKDRSLLSSMILNKDGGVITFEELGKLVKKYQVSLISGRLR
jgi:hypothetical protein